MTGYQPLAGCGELADPAAAPYDRRWLVVNSGNQWLSRERCPRLADIQAEMRPGYLVLRAPGVPRLDIPLDIIEDDDTAQYQLLLDEQVITVIDEGELAAAWISNVARVPCGIAKIHPDHSVLRWPV
jgi:hypothetical protein